MITKPVQDYIDALPDERREAFSKLINTFMEHLPKGFELCISYNMPTFVVPLSRYPQGYHCKAETPLPFISVASQKNFIAVYHMGIYAQQELLDWFVQEYPKYCKTKLDMGKSCIRFKKPEQIPFELLGQLAEKISVDEWIALYEKSYRK